MTPEEKVTNEKLHDALQDLERARERERGYRLESEALIEGLRVLNTATETTDIFEKLGEVFRDVLHFEEAFVLLLKSDGTMKSLASTRSTFAASKWVPDELFRKVLEGEVVRSPDIGQVREWSQQPASVREGVTSALHASINTDKARTIFVCTHSSQDFFSSEHVQLVERFAPLAAQALIRIETRSTEIHRAKLQQETSGYLRQLSMLERATDALGIGIAIWQGDGDLEQVSSTLQKMTGDWSSVSRWWKVARDKAESSLGTSLFTHAENRGTAVVVELETPGGSRRIFRFAFSARDDAKDSRGLILFVTDVTSERLAERKRRESEERFSNLFQHSNDGILLHDLEGNIVDVNQKAVDWLGYSKPELLTMKVLTLHPPSEAEKSRLAFEKIKENGHVTMEIAFLKKDGMAFPAEVSASLFKVGARKLAQGIIRDVTHRTKAQTALRESENRKSAILETALDCILTIDHEGRVLEFNPAAEKTFGYSRDEAVGRTMADLIIPPRLREQHRQGMLRHLETGEARVIGRHIELPAVRKDGTEFPVEVAITRIPTDGPPLFTGYLRDITDRKQAEETMRVAKEAAESTSRAKTEFVASVSHEVRTPLNIVMGMTDLALDTGVTPEQREYLEAIRSNSEVLLRLINDILDFSKIEAGRMVVQREPVDLAGLVESVARSLQPRATNKGLEVTTNIDDAIPPNLAGDSDRMRQVLLNLIGNAIKFTSEGGIVVQLRSEGAHGDKERVHIEVRDTGVGIPDEMRDKIFDRFFQIDGTMTRKYGGTGLGLSITRSLIELMGGRIWIDSTVDVGTAVHIELDMETSDRKAVLEPIAGIKPLVERLEAASGMATGHILLVEDHVDNQKLATRILKRAGYEVDLAVDGEEAQQRVRDFAYDLIFMDLEMPVMDGLEATRRIRAFERSSGRKRVPIVALSAHAVEGYREQCLEVGMDDHLAKPVTRRILLGGAEMWVDRSPWVLVVEDSEDSRKLVGRYLQSAGVCRLLFAEREDEVCRLVERYGVSMVLLDMELRGTSGYELAEALRSIPGGDALALVAMTGHRGPEEEKKCFEAGCSHYIGKPFSKEQLVGLVQEILGTTDTLETVKRPEDAPVAESLPPIDIEIDPELADLIPEFLDNRRVQADELVTFIESGDFDAVRRAGHNLKGSGEPYGFHELTRLGALIEQSAQAREKNKLERYTEELRDYLNRVRAVPPS